MPLAGTSGDRCAVYFNGRAMFAKSKNQPSQKALSPVWANTCWQNHFSKESWMPKTLPTIAATFTMEMGMHLHRLGSVGRSESQRVDTVVACCCHVLYLFYLFTHAKWIQMDPNCKRKLPGVGGQIRWRWPSAELFCQCHQHTERWYVPGPNFTPS